MPEGQWISMTCAFDSLPNPKCTGPWLDEAYPTLVVIWLYCAPALVTTLILAPIPSRLLLVPSSSTASQWLSFSVRFIQSSAGWSNALTTTSILPSPSKSAKAQPRCRLGGAASNPASAVKACHLPPAPRLRKTVLGCATSVPGLGKASTCPRDTNKSFHPSLSKSNNPGP